MLFTHEIADIYITDYVKWNIQRYLLIHLEYTRAIRIQGRKCTEKTKRKCSGKIPDRKKRKRTKPPPILEAPGGF
jgi:hypothetical protein